MPGAGHIVHMPSHIYYRVGRYEDAVKVNEAAARVDESYIAQCRAQGFYPLAYYAHNIHFLWTSSAMMGREAAALDAARRVVAATSNGPAVQLPPLQLYLYVPIVTDIRFGRWNEALAEPLPDPALKLVLVMSHYARGYAFANLKRLPDARREREALQAMIDTHALAPIDGFLLPGTTMAQLATAVLDGEIARNSGDLPAAIGHFRRAWGIERVIPYTEPPYWYQPVSHLLGAALLEARRPDEAEDVYRASLMNYRLDGWALFGLAEALDSEGKHAEAAKARRDFADAWRLADVKLTASRF
ncbi:MAG: hypothetical protein JOZ55_06445 [Alphaproteobacteria bacterium]|nr:hypothetical protein [Alphaproteobacteria bacterium]